VDPAEYVILRGEFLRMDAPPTVEDLIHIVVHGIYTSMFTVDSVLLRIS
jgi:hypothetical protein